MTDGVPWIAAGQVGAASDGSIQREVRLDEPVEDQWGRSDSFDPDNVGDIADEGAGHRG